MCFSFPSPWCVGVPSVCRARRDVEQSASLFTVMQDTETLKTTVAKHEGLFTFVRG